jgi:riboflavin biosynthesis pyrimidine reductase
LTTEPVLVWPPQRGSAPAGATPGHAVDLVALVAGDARPAPADRPWVVASMVASADGSAADATGVSGGLGGPADRQIFSALRAVADVVVAGAATVTAEHYGPARPSEAVRRQRRARGQSDRPRIAVATASLRVDPRLRLFTDSPADARPVILTVDDADPDRRRHLEVVAEVHDTGRARVDWPTALALLRRRYDAEVVLCEGGPHTIAQLVAADLLDELCLTVAPTLVAGDGPRIAVGAAPDTARPLELDRVVVADGDLLLRYVRAHAA